MNGYQNPVNFLRRLISALKGLKKAEQWQMYLAAAFLSIVLSLAFVVHMAFWGQGKGAIERLPRQETIHTTPVTVPVAEPQAEAMREKSEKNSEVKAEVKPEMGKRDEMESVPQNKVEAKREMEDKAEQKDGAQTRPAAKAKQSGEWYHDEVYKEWRFKRK